MGNGHYSMGKENNTPQGTLPKTARSENGYLHIRRGVFEHTTRAKMGITDFAVYSSIHNHADFQTGVCLSNARALNHEWPELEEATVEQAMRRLRKRGYIAYRYGRGQKGSYDILINKFEPYTGLLQGWRLRADLSYDLSDPIYEYVSPTDFQWYYSEVLDVMNDMQQEINNVLRSSADSNADVLKSVAGGDVVGFQLDCERVADESRTYGYYSSSVIQQFTDSILNSSGISEENGSFFATEEPQIQTLLSPSELDEAAKSFYGRES